MRPLLLAAFLLATLCLLPAGLRAQAIKAYTDYDAQGYVISQEGYPGALVPDGETGFYYVELWQKADYGRTLPGRYLQHVHVVLDEQGNFFFQEDWFVRLDLRSLPPLAITEVLPLKGGVVVIGVFQDRKGMQTYALSYDKRGQLVSPPKLISRSAERVKAYTQEFTLAPDRSHYLWLAAEADAKPGKRQYFAHALDLKGQSLWEGPLEHDLLASNYTLSRAHLLNDGNLYLLLEPEARYAYPSTSPAPVQVLHYSYRSRVMRPLALTLPDSLYTVASTSILQPDGRLSVAHILGKAEADSTSITATTPADESQHWAALSVQTVHYTDALAITSDSLSALPTALVSSLQGPLTTPGHNTLPGDGQAFWLFEEATTQGNQYHRGRVLTFAFNTQTGALDWASVLEKDQRHVGNAALLSYFPALGADFLYLTYLTNTGAEGSLQVAALNRKTGGIVQTELEANADASWYFFPGRATQLDPNHALLLGLGAATENGYRIILLGLTAKARQ